MDPNDTITENSAAAGIDTVDTVAGVDLDAARKAVASTKATLQQQELAVIQEELRLAEAAHAELVPQCRAAQDTFDDLDKKVEAQLHIMHQANTRKAGAPMATAVYRGNGMPRYATHAEKEEWRAGLVLCFTEEENANAAAAAALAEVSRLQGEEAHGDDEATESELARTRFACSCGRPEKKARENEAAWRSSWTVGASESSRQPGDGAHERSHSPERSSSTSQYVDTTPGMPTFQMIRKFGRRTAQETDSGAVLSSPRRFAARCGEDAPSVFPVSPLSPGGITIIPPISKGLGFGASICKCRMNRRAHR